MTTTGLEVAANTPLPATQLAPRLTHALLLFGVLVLVVLANGSFFVAAESSRCVRTRRPRMEQSGSARAKVQAPALDAFLKILDEIS